LFKILASNVGRGAVPVDAGWGMVEYPNAPDDDGAARRRLLFSGDKGANVSAPACGRGPPAYTVFSVDNPPLKDKDPDFVNGPNGTGVGGTGYIPSTSDWEAVGGGDGVYWFLGDVVHNCDTTCDKRSLACTENHWPTTEKAFKEIVSDMGFVEDEETGETGCKSTNAGDWDMNPSVTAGGSCFWKSDSINRCKGTSSGDYRHFCACVARGSEDAAEVLGARRRASSRRHLLGSVDVGYDPEFDEAETYPKDGEAMSGDREDLETFFEIAGNFNSSDWTAPVSTNPVKADLNVTDEEMDDPHSRFACFAGFNKKEVVGDDEYAYKTRRSLLVGPGELEAVSRRYSCAGPTGNATVNVTLYDRTEGANAVCAGQDTYAKSTAVVPVPADYVRKCYSRTEAVDQYLELSSPVLYPAPYRAFSGCAGWDHVELMIALGIDPGPLTSAKRFDFPVGRRRLGWPWNEEKNNLAFELGYDVGYSHFDAGMMANADAVYDPPTAEGDDDERVADVASGLEGLDFYERWRAQGATFPWDGPMKK